MLRCGVGVLMRGWVAMGSVLVLLAAPGLDRLARAPGWLSPWRAAQAQPARAEAPRAEQGRAEQNRTEQNRAEPNRAAPQERVVTIVNELGLAMRELYVAPAGNVERATDRLGMDTLPTGASLRLSLGRQSLCLFDLRAVLADGSTRDKRGADLCRNPRVTFGDPSAPLREATVENVTDLALRELYATPATPGGRATERGPDRLGAELVPPDSSFTLRLGRTRDCVYDVTAVFEDDSVEERRRADLCRRARLVFGDPAVPRRELEVANGSGRTMRSLFAATQPVPAGQERTPEQWGPDRIGASPVEAGETLRLRLRARACQADLRAVYEDDTEEVKRGVELCAATGRTLFDGSGIPRAPERLFTLVNRHAAAVEEVYASSVDDTDWGDDKLGGTALERGARQEIMLRGGCQMDLRVVFGTGGAEERRNIDVCATATVVLRPGWVLADKLDVNPGPDQVGPPREGSVRLRNTGSTPLVELYVQAPGAPRGPDRLGATVLGRGETLDFQPPEAVGCTATLFAIFRDGQEAVRPALNLCAGNEVALP